jgi:hypothetical protein
MAKAPSYLPINMPASYTVEEGLALVETSGEIKSRDDR